MRLSDREWEALEAAQVVRRALDGKQTGIAALDRLNAQIERRQRARNA